MTDDLTPDLRGEQSRADEAATAGIVARESVPELTPDVPVLGVSGDADDDDAVDAPDEQAATEDGDL